MSESRFGAGFQRLAKALLVALVFQIGAVSDWAVNRAQAQDVTIELDEVTAAIKGQDVTIHARTTGEVDEVKLWIRKLLELGPFNDVPMEKVGGTTFRYVLPLSQEQGEVGRLEYYLEAFKGGQSVAKTDSNVISFIDPPFIGEIASASTEGLEKEDWKLFIKGRISRPFYKRWWVYALAGAIAVPTTYFLAKGDDPVPGPPTVQLLENEDASENGQFGLVCQGQVPMALSIRGGSPPFEVLFTISNPGGQYRLNVDGVTQFPEDQTIVVAAASVTPSNFDQPGDFAVIYPNLQLTPIAVNVAVGGLEFGAIVRDSLTSTTFAGATPGSPLPSNIRTAIDQRSDERLIDENAFLVFVSNCAQTP